MLKRDCLRNYLFGAGLVCSFMMCSTAILRAHAAGEDFILPDHGCPMAHCDPHMSDNMNLQPPVPQGSETVDIIWHDQLPYGSLIGLGCSGNDDIVACTFANKDGFDNLIVYDSEGQVKWTSGNLLNSKAVASAPLVSITGEVIACDNESIYRFNSVDGSLVWAQQFPREATPISPVINENGIIIIATKGGPVYAYDSRDGRYIAELYVKNGADDPGYYETINTPSTDGNRIYVSMSHTLNNEDGRLVAIDLDASNPDGEQRLKVAWSYGFGGPSGASPMLVKDRFGRRFIYFDGNTGTPESPGSTIFGLLDRGNNYRQLFARHVEDVIVASFPRDPRGGFWYYPSYRKWLVRLGPFGAELQRIDIDALLNAYGVHVPSSAMGIAGTPTDPVMIVSSTVFPVTAPGTDGSTYVVAIDLVNERIVWKVLVENNYQHIPAGQFHIFDDINGKPCVAFSSRLDGVRCAGIR